MFRKHENKISHKITDETKVEVFRKCTTNLKVLEKF